MSQGEQQRGAAWVRQHFTELLQEHDAADRHRGWHLMPPQDAGGEYFDRVQRDHLVRYYQRRLAELGVNALIVEAVAS